MNLNVVVVVVVFCELHLGILLIFCKVAAKVSMGELMAKDKVQINFYVFMSIGTSGRRVS